MLDPIIGEPVVGQPNPELERISGPPKLFMLHRIYYFGRAASLPPGRGDAFQIKTPPEQRVSGPDDSPGGASHLQARPNRRAFL